jgi:hypothetical protein
MRKQKELTGFITMIVVIILLLAVAIGFAYLRVVKANS